MARKPLDDALPKRPAKGRSKRAGRTTGARIGRKLIGVAALIGIAYFAIEGGEYGTSDLLKQRNRDRSLKRAIDSLTKQVDSLKRYKRALATDIKLQERIAREEFGMVKGDKEILYRFAEPRDSVAVP